LWAEQDAKMTKGSVERRTPQWRLHLGMMGTIELLLLHYRHAIQEKQRNRCSFQKMVLHKPTRGSQYCNTGFSTQEVSAWRSSQSL